MCGFRPAMEGRRKCAFCAETASRLQSQRGKIRRDRLRAAGLCTKCGGPTDGAHVTCAACRERWQGYSRKTRQRRRDTV